MIRNYLQRAYRFALAFLHARANYKLFLKVSFTELEPRTRHLAAATDFFSSLVRPIPIRAPFGDSVLVVAPHQDDEVIGCGGALALQVQTGRNAYVVLIQDGCIGHTELGMPRADMVRMRNAESERAAGLLGIEPPRFLGHEDLIASASAAAAELRSIVRERKVDAIFAPFILDGHVDHRLANYILADAIRDIPWNVRVLGYEVWGLCIPNVIVVIDEVIERKLDMLACFTFANSAVDYVHTTKGLNMYHSRMLGAGVCQYAERFFELPREDYVAMVDRLRSDPRSDCPDSLR